MHTSHTAGSVLQVALIAMVASATIAAENPPTAWTPTPLQTVMDPAVDGAVLWPDEAGLLALAESVAADPAGAAALADAKAAEEPRTLADALFGGKVSADLRLRFEYADFNDTGSAGHGYAATARLRLGYGTRPIHGFSAFAEYEGVWAADNGTYFDTLNDQFDDATIADPPTNELNQLYGKYDANGLSVIGGRQRITLDDHRFIGNVGWRQDEQTFDAASIKYKGFAGVPVIEDITFYYAYLWKINRIIADDGNYDSDTHLVNLSYEGLDIGKLTLFGYFLDFRGDAPPPINRSNTVGARFAGSRDVAEELALGYVLSYARQFDAGLGEMFDADYYLAELSLTHKPSGLAIGAGYEVLASDGGMYAFQTPLATLHAFQGWADAFLTTPDTGIEDLYLFVHFPLPFDAQGKVVGHVFWQEDGPGDLFGYEIDAQVSRKITEWMSVLAKVAWLEADASTVGAPGDVVRFWFQIEMRY